VGGRIVTPVRLNGGAVAADARNVPAEQQRRAEAGGQGNDHGDGGEDGHRHGGSGGEGDRAGGGGGDRRRPGRRTVQVDEEAGGEGERVKARKGGVQEEEEEELVVAHADATPNPNAVVVKAQN